MKTITPLFLFIWLILSYPTPIQADIISGQVINSNMSPAASVNATAMDRSNVDLFHGQLSVGIPLYTLRGRHLSLPVSLVYSQGSEPQHLTFKTGWTGYGWSLQAGGVITRTLRGKPDEAMCTPGSRNFHPITNTLYDHMEDVFNFNFCGYSGTFFFRDGVPVIRTKNEILNIQVVWHTYYSNQVAGFIMHTPDGTLYTFGYEPLAYSVPTTQQLACREESHRFVGKSGLNSERYISAWYLSKIQSPEGDVIEFQYEKGAYNECALSDRANYSTSYARFSTRSATGDIYQAFGNTMEEASGTFIQPSFLKKITTNGPVDMEFTRSLATEKDYPSSFYSSPHAGIPEHFSTSDMEKIQNSRWYKLDAVRLLDKTNGNRCFKEYLLSYQQGTNIVRKLVSVTEKGIPQSGSAQTKPPVSFQYSNQPEEGNSIIEVLKRVTYPGGGYNEYEYERHEYSNKPVSQSNNSKGVRVKTVKAYPAAGEKPWETHYLYVKDGGIVGVPGTQTSGIINRREMKTYTTSFAALDGVVEWEKQANYDMAVGQMGVPAAARVGYSTVYVRKERNNEKGELTRYEYSNLVGGYFSETTAGSYNSIDVDGQRVSYPEHGYLLSVMTPSGRTDYTYESMNLEADTLIYTNTRYLPFMYRISGYPSGVFSKKEERKYKYANAKMKVKTITQYTLGSRLDTIMHTTYTYNQDTGNVIFEEVENKKENTIHTTSYYYPYNSLSDMSRDGARQINVPYEIVTEKDGKVISAEINEMKRINSFRELVFFQTLEKVYFYS